MPRDKGLKSIGLPNIISFIALFLAWAAIILLLRGEFYLSFAVVVIAFILDAFDGLLARILKEESEFGRQLDGHVDVFIYLIYPALVYYLHFNLRSGISIFALFVFIGCGIFRLVRHNKPGLTTAPKPGGKAYVGLPVFINHAPILILMAWKIYLAGSFFIAAHIIILLNSVLMALRFRFPKPSNIWPFVILLLIVSTMMAYFGVYGY